MHRSIQRIEIALVKWKICDHQYQRPVKVVSKASPHRIDPRCDATGRNKYLPFAIRIDNGGREEKKTSSENITPMTGNCTGSSFPGEAINLWWLWTFFCLSFDCHWLWLRIKVHIFFVHRRQGLYLYIGLLPRSTQEAVIWIKMPLALFVSRLTTPTSYHFLELQGS